MSETPQRLSDESRPCLCRGVRIMHNEAQGGWLLLAPERVFKADVVTAEIVNRCTGKMSIAAIVDELANLFTGAPRERIHDDVVALLGDLAEKRLLELQ